MKQRLKDIGVMIKNDRKAKAIAGGVVAFVLLWFYLQSNEGKRTHRAVAQNKGQAQVGTGSMGSKEAYDDIIQRFNSELKDTQSAIQEIKQSNDETKKTIQDYEARSAEIFKKILERMSDVEAGASTQQASYSGASPVDVPGDENAAAMAGGSEELEPFGGLDDVAPAPPAPPVRNKVAVIGIGDSVRVKLLAGVNAPTDGTPYPVVFKLNDDVTGPDGSRLPLGEARLLAAAQGSLTDSRALFRLTDLSIRLPDGQRRMYKVDGWVVGEDGIRGMSGQLIDPIGKVIGGAVVVGGMEGAANALARTQITDTITSDGGINSAFTGNVGEYAAAKALAGGANTWSDIIKDRLDQMVPHVEVLSGREATAVFAKSVAIDGLFETLGDSESIYASLD